MAGSCGVGHRGYSDLTLLWLWCRLVSTAPIRPLAREPPYAMGVALKKKKAHNNHYFLFFFFFRAASVVYGSSQARGQIGTAAASLHHSHSNRGSELHLQPTSQLMAMPEPRPTERGQGSNPHPHGY